MATITLARRSPGRHPASQAAPVAFVWQDESAEREQYDENYKYSIHGVDAAGLIVPLGGKCTLTNPASSDTSKGVAQQTSAMTLRLMPLAVGNANLSATLTFTDGSQGPYTVTLPLTITGNPAIRLSAYPNGTPTAV